MAQQYYPTKSIEGQEAVTPDPSGASQAVYVLLRNKKTKLAVRLTGQTTYMQQDVTDANRPDGHMTLEYEFDPDLTWTPNNAKIAYLQNYTLKAPAKFVWWRSMFPSSSAPNGYKRRTYSIAAGEANTGDLITFQNSVYDGTPSPPTPAGLQNTVIFSNSEADSA